MRSSLLLSVLLSLVSQTLAQAVEINGVIAGVQGSIVLIKADDGQVAYAHTVRPPRSKAQPCVIEITGSESAKNLQPGMFVQFEATLAGRRNVVGKVAALTIVTPTDIGILTHEPLTADVNAKSKKAAAAPREKCLVVGKIARVGEESLTLVLPDEKGKSMNLSLPLAPQCSVEIHASSLALTRVGDRIQAKGKLLQPQHLSADSIKVEHTPPGTGTPPQTPAKPEPPENDLPRPEQKPPGDPKPEVPQGDE